LPHAATVGQRFLRLVLPDDQEERRRTSSPALARANPCPSGSGARNGGSACGYRDFFATPAGTAVPGTTRRQPRRTVYLYIAVLGVNARSCRGQGRAPRYGVTSAMACAQSAAVNSASRGRRLTGPVTESNQSLRAPAQVAAVRIALRTVAGDVLRARSACSRSALGVMPSADMSARTGTPIARRSRKLNRRPGALQVGAIPDGSRARPSPGPKPRKRHLCDCRPGWEAKARPRVRSSMHSSQRLVGATCQPLQ
jgi:hypothetical protein